MSFRRRQPPREESPIPDIPPELPMPSWQQRKNSSGSGGLVSQRDLQRIGIPPLRTNSSTKNDKLSPASPVSRATRDPPPIRTQQEMSDVPKNMLIEEVLGGLRQLAVSPTPVTPTGVRRKYSIPMMEQRHPGKPDAKIHRTTKTFEMPRNEETPELPMSMVSGDIPKKSEPVGEARYVSGFPLVCLMVGLMFAVFLISIDRTIISTAIPNITEEFKSTPDIGWYGSAYMLTACAFQPMFGRIYTIFSVKVSYLVAMFLFELGSLLCGVSQTSMTLIIGRAIAGLGCAGILTGSFVVVSTAIPLHLRPVFIAIVGLMFGIGASLGPLLGGVFTDLVTWRWCFYINLPVGGATVAAMILFFHPAKNKGANRPFWERVLALDILGNALLLAASIMLFLALEYTTQGIAWSSAEVIGLLTGCGVVAIIFIVWQWWKGEEALMPPRIVTQRTVAASCGMAFMTYGALINLTFFLPIWFQAIKDDSAIGSGVNMIPYFLVNAFFSLLAGIFVSIIGYVTPPAVIGSAIGTIGLGLLTLLNPRTTTAQWVGYEILSSAGFGLSIQQGFTAVQTVLGEDDMAVGTAAVVASQSLGGAVILSVGNSVFQNQLLKASESNILPGVDIKRVIDVGAASFRHLVPDDELPLMLEVYNAALRMVFIVGIPMGALAAIISCFIEFKSVKVNKAGDTAQSRAEEGREKD
ncbi:major facilitator superfamily domain-containing protein [Cercophora samala]|uniref:Major facilitator superfamily domain-containing protein n=1 Tax=Cercophora samala TaxID=330535 RepID=A0AA39ZLJ9_9PEZI|nr:major facilitator superfamily domain-containing protein [Cercophora samala]